MPIAEVVIHVGDLDAAIAWYGDACGFELVRALRDGPVPVAELDAGHGQRVSLVADGRAGIELAIGSRDVRADRRRLRRRRAEGVGEPVPVDGGTWLPATDPWGNRVGFLDDRAPS